MESANPLEIFIKKEPAEPPCDDEDDGRAGAGTESVADPPATPPAVSAAPLRYVSRRGRPPGGGYSMKAPTHYVRFSAAPLTGGSSSSSCSSGASESASGASDLSPQRLAQLAGAVPGLDSLELGRFGAHAGFDLEKNSFRCEGCDVVFSSRDTYAMHMLLRAKNESCVALPTSAISANPENPTPREKFERELRQKAMISALRSQAEAMSKAAAALLPKPLLPESVLPASTAAATTPVKDEAARIPSRSGSTAPSSFAALAERSLGFNSLLALDAYGLYMDPTQYRRFLTEYGLHATSSAAAINGSALAAMMEQLACSVCGEIFNNKDALAMHMMFHTREEGEAEDLRAKIRLRDTWMLNASSASGGNSSMFESSSFATQLSKTLSGQEATSHSSSNNHSSRGGKKCDDRQLTAERVAELKRMAIESSLRAPSSTSAGRSRTLPSQRPRSATDDSTVTSTAQPRPLSADDARQLARNSARGSFDLTNPTRSWPTDPRPYRKRHSSNRESCLSSARSPLKHQLSPRKLMRWGYSKNTPPQQRVGSFKVCDNHVSSATGPQDSDETSKSPTFNNEGIPNNEPISYGSDESGDFYGRVKGIPYLDAIMSHEAELVPVEGLDSDKDIEDGTAVGQYSRGEGGDSSIVNLRETPSALDFSLGAQRGVGGDGGSGVRDRWSGDLRARPFAMTNGKTPEFYSKFRNAYEGTTSNNNNNNNNNSTNNNSNSTNNTTNTEDTHHRPGSPRFPQSAATNLSPPTPGTGARSLDSVCPAPPPRVGEARYCPHCEILFLDVTLFHLHMGLHNVNNPWQCNTCGLACSGRLEFNTHVLHY
ncbi:hypothetical protein EGW08_008176 [Elysia chlorotica]|uniref:C2H2-type domain-containing protein n=1 Tax=Elysia chlorotica TaxID=188477 RepID=A0A433TR76_ELYCH|nr:hypothetical protein EGW08_008176 [Elysia chlorotica]